MEHRPLDEQILYYKDPRTGLITVNYYLKQYYRLKRKIKKAIHELEAIKDNVHTLLSRTNEERLYDLQLGRPTEEKSTQ